MDLQLCMRAYSNAVKMDPKFPEVSLVVYVIVYVYKII